MKNTQPLLTLPFVLTAFAIELFCLALGTRSLAFGLYLLARAVVFPRSAFHEQAECSLTPRLVPISASIFASVKRFALHLYS